MASEQGRHSTAYLQFPFRVGQSRLIATSRFARQHALHGDAWAYKASYLRELAPDRDTIRAGFSQRLIGEVNDTMLLVQSVAALRTHYCWSNCVAKAASSNQATEPSRRNRYPRQHEHGNQGRIDQHPDYARAPSPALSLPVHRARDMSCLARIARIIGLPWPSVRPINRSAQ
jgi:hypothetical protein